MEVAIDGTTRETYAKHRIGGDLEMVLSNLKKLIAIRNKLGSRRPIIEWQMIDYESNKPEQKEARMIARDLGADVFAIKPDCFSTYPTTDHLRENRCRLLWSALAV